MPGYNKMLGELPKVGELWTNTVAGVDGIVVELEGTVVVISSLTGVRAAVEFNRSYNPWQRLQGAPVGTDKCSRALCSNPAIAWYQRPSFLGHEVACPRHIPRGVRSTMLARERFAPMRVKGQICPNCQTDATEVLGEISTALRDTTLWTCMCGTWWIRAIRTLKAIMQSNIMDVALRAVPDGYTFLGMTHTQDGPCQVLYFQILVRPKLGMQITGPKPMTLFEHLLHDED